MVVRDRFQERLGMKWICKLMFFYQLSKLGPKNIEYPLYVLAH